jgi:hypothetical protein
MYVGWNNKKYTDGNGDLPKLLMFTGVENYVIKSEEKKFTGLSLQTGATSKFSTHISGVRGSAVG